MSRMTAYLAGLALIVAGAGCSALQPNKTAAPIAEPPAYPPPAMVALEFKSASGKTKVQEIPLEPAMTVGDAIEKTRAHKKYRRMTVDLQRTPRGGMPHKMPIEFDNGANRVGHSTNYDLHPNDRILITEDTSTIVDDLMAKFVPTGGKRR